MVKVFTISSVGSTFAFRKRWGQIDWRSLGEFSWRKTNLEQCCIQLTLHSQFVSLSFTDIHVTPWTVPPRKRSPQTAHGRIIGPPQPNIAAIPGPPLLLTVSPAADCGLFAIAFATALAYGEQPGRCLLDQNKVRQHLLKSAGGGDDTTPIEEKSA